MEPTTVTAVLVFALDAHVIYVDGNLVVNPWEGDTEGLQPLLAALGVQYTEREVDGDDLMQYEDVPKKLAELL